MNFFQILLEHHDLRNYNRAFLKQLKYQKYFKNLLDTYGMFGVKTRSTITTNYDVK